MGDQLIPVGLGFPEFKTKILCPRICLSPKQTRTVGHPLSEASIGCHIPNWLHSKFRGRATRPVCHTEVLGKLRSAPGLPIHRLQETEQTGHKFGRYGDKSHQTTAAWDHLQWTITRETVKDYLDQGLANFWKESVAISGFVSLVVSAAKTYHCRCSTKRATNNI